MKAGGIKSGFETLCFSLDTLHYHSAAVHLCRFESARTDDSKTRKRQEGSRLASHIWLRWDNVTGGVKTAKIKTKAPSSRTKSDLTQHFRTRNHYFAFKELRLS